MNTIGKWIASFGLLGLLAAAGCSTEPQGQDARNDLNGDVDKTMPRLYSEDPGLKDFLSRSYGYVCFPTVGKGAVIIGGAYGRGEVFDNGNFVGYADISQGTIGAQLGGQSYTELLAFENEAALKRFEEGKFTFAANASAVALKSGAAATAKYTDGVAAFVEPQGGLMLEAAIGGQSFTYQPK